MGDVKENQSWARVLPCVHAFYSRLPHGLIDVRIAARCGEYCARQARQGGMRHPLVLQGLASVRYWPGRLITIVRGSWRRGRVVIRRVAGGHDKRRHEFSACVAA